MLPHDALRMACFDQRGRPVVNAWTADVPDMMTSAGEDVEPRGEFVGKKGTGTG